MPRETFLLAADDEPKPATKQPHSDAQKLLDFLQRWPKTTISSRDIRIYGPTSIRDRESATNTAEALVKHGWLIPNKTTRTYGGEPLREWQIVRKAIFSPVVAL